VELVPDTVFTIRHLFEEAVKLPDIFHTLGTPTNSPKSLKSMVNPNSRSILRIAVCAGFTDDSPGRDATV
jgi:hypothetical protein